MKERKKERTEQKRKEKTSWLSTLPSLHKTVGLDQCHKKKEKEAKTQPKDHAIDYTVLVTTIKL